jgi:MerR family transcriptional regulator, thiopeptide resistance regulator
MSYTVGELATLAGVTVRTLHHYDRIGLLVPEDRTGSAGYRRYGTESVERLHRILSYRELGLNLNEIATLLDDPDADRLAHLRRQERLLRERIARLEEMVVAVQLMIEAEHMAVRLTPEERFELFGDFDVEAHVAEAEERWGDTDAFKESQRRVARYGADEWRRIKAEAEEIEAGFAAAHTDGEPPGGDRAIELAERHRAHISRWFYECPTEIHRGLGALYVADPRFTEHYDRIAEGLARFVCDAIAANAERAQAAAEG